MILAAVALLSSTAVDLPPSMMEAVNPTFNVSAVRLIECDKWAGSGFLIDDNILVTALHVATGTKCVDAATGKPLKTYYKDPARDFALMSGDLPDMPYIKISCQRYVANQHYTAYGISSYFSDSELIRSVKATATGEHKNVDYRDGGGAKGIAYLVANTVPGMSGGPYVDDDGYAHGMVNAGSTILGIPTGVSYSYEFTDTILCRRSS